MTAFWAYCPVEGNGQHNHLFNLYQKTGYQSVIFTAAARKPILPTKVFPLALRYILLLSAGPDLKYVSPPTAIHYEDIVSTFWDLCIYIYMYMANRHQICTSTGLWSQEFLNNRIGPHSYLLKNIVSLCMLACVILKFLLEFWRSGRVQKNVLL